MIDTEDLIDAIIGDSSNVDRLKKFIKVWTHDTMKSLVKKPVFKYFCGENNVVLEEIVWLQIESNGQGDRPSRSERTNLYNLLLGWVKSCLECEIIGVHTGTKGEHGNYDLTKRIFSGSELNNLSLGRNRIDIFLIHKSLDDAENQQSLEAFSNFDFRWLSFLTVNDQNQVSLSSAQQLDLHKRLDHMSSHDYKLVEGSDSVVGDFLQSEDLSYRGIRHKCSTCGYNPKVQGEWHSCCPVCKIQANNKRELESLFGWRTEKYKGKPRKYPQARCKKHKNV